MKFKKWFEESGLSMYALARMCMINRMTIKNLVDGKRPSVKTVNKLIKMTKRMTVPVSYDLFEKVKGKRRKEKICLLSSPKAKKPSQKT